MKSCPIPFSTLKLDPIAVSPELHDDVAETGFPESLLCSAMYNAPITDCGPAGPVGQVAPV